MSLAVGYSALCTNEASSRAAIEVEALEWLGLVIEHAAAVSPAQQHQHNNATIRTPRTTSTSTTARSVQVKSISDMCRHFVGQPLPPPPLSPRDGGMVLFGAIHGHAVTSAPRPPAGRQQGVRTSSGQQLDHSDHYYHNVAAGAGGSAVKSHPPGLSPLLPSLQKTNHHHQYQQQPHVATIDLAQQEVQRGFVAEDEKDGRASMEKQEAFERGYLADEQAAFVTLCREKEATRRLASLHMVEQEAIEERLHGKDGVGVEGLDVSVMSRASGSTRPITAPSASMVMMGVQSTGDDWSKGGISPTRPNDGVRPFPAAAPRGRTAQQPWGTMVAISTSARKRSHSGVGGGGGAGGIMRPSTGNGADPHPPPPPLSDRTCYSGRRDQQQHNPMQLVLRPVRFALPQFSLSVPAPVFPGSRPTGKSRYLFTSRD